MFSIKNIILVAIFSLALHVVSAQEVMSLDQVLRAVDENNPSLKSYELRSKSQDAKIAGAKAWMAPMVGVGTFMTPYPGSEVMGNENKGALMFSLEQDIPNPAKTRSKSQYLASQSKITQAERAVAFNELRARSRQLYFDLLIGYKKIRLQKENQAIMQNMKKLATIRYPYNQGGLNQVFKAEGREYEAENMILMTEGEIRSKKAALNALMNRPVNAVLEPDTSYKVDFNPSAAVDSAYLSANRSDILQMDRTISAMQLNIEQMRKEAKPDFRLKFDHMRSYSSMMPSQFTAMGMLSIPIAPWSSGMYKSEVKSMKFEVDAMRSQRAAMLTEMAGMTRSMVLELQSMQVALSNYEKKIIPVLNKNLSISMLSYQENKLDLNTVIDAWEAKTMAQMNYLDQLQKFYQMFTEYEKNIEK